MSIIPQTKKKAVILENYMYIQCFQITEFFFLFRMLYKEEESILPVRIFDFFMEISTDSFCFVFYFQTLMALCIIIHSESEKYKLESCLEPLSNCFV